ncbi:MAG: hypothetical protein Q4A07_11725 [Coriobacteriales bacterium]|nr:hypothetical protein [Coriobacteriales bacterium]
MKIVVKPVNPAFRDLLLEFVSQMDEPRYTLVGTEGPFNSSYVFECDEENYWAAVDGMKAIIRESPLGLIMGCQVVPHGMLTWPPLYDKDKYPKPE